MICDMCKKPFVDADRAYGYKDRKTGELVWYCEKHRLAQFYADACKGPRLPPVMDSGHPIWSAPNAAAR